MDYEIVSLEAKTVVGLTARTGNSDPKMNEVIGGLWKRLFGDGLFFSMKNKVNEHSIGLYSNYEDGMTGAYDITVGCEVSGTPELPPDAVVKTIPAGRYAKFVVHGDMVKAVGAAWVEIWNTPLDRAYTGDFEEYVSQDAEHGEIDIYIALKLF